MKNPWKRYSNINPQRENGNRQIANDVFCALMCCDFTGADYKIIFAILHKTWGFNKDDDSISIRQFVEMTNLNERTVQRTLKKLYKLRVVYLSPFGRRVTTGSPLNKYSLNKHYDTWMVEGRKSVQGCHVDHPSKADKGGLHGNIRVTPGPPTKETITKETITKEKEITSFPKNENEEQDQVEDFYFTGKKKKLSGKRLETFMQFWDAFDYKSGKAEAADTWLDIPTLTDVIVDKIIIAANKEALNRPELISSGKTPKMAQGWLSGKRWEDEIKTYIQEEGFKPRNIKEAKDLEQIKMAKYLKEKRRERANGGNNTRAANGNERQLPKSTSS